LFIQGHIKKEVKEAVVNMLMNLLWKTEPGRIKRRAILNQMNFGAKLADVKMKASIKDNSLSTNIAKVLGFLKE
jgi:hypothetical protein